MIIYLKNYNYFIF